MGVADRYLARRVLAPLLAIILVVGVVVSLWQLGRVSTMVLLNLRDVGLLASIIVDLVPSFSGIALGTAGIFGCLLAYDRMAEDGELSAMAAAGIPPWRVFLPATVASVGLFSAQTALGIWGDPWGASHYNHDVSILATRSFSRTLEPGTFTVLGDLGAVYVEAAHADDRGNAVWDNLVLGRDMPQGPLVLTAKQARVEVAGVGLLYLETTHGEALLPADKPEDINHVQYESASVTVNVADWIRSNTMGMGAFQLWDLPALWEETQRADTGKEHRKAVFHFWQKLFLPFSMPLLALIGAIIGGQRAAQARARAYILAALAVAVCFGLFGFGKNLVMQGAVPGWVGSNLQNMVGVAALVWLWRTRIRMAG